MKIPTKYIAAIALGVIVTLVLFEFRSCTHTQADPQAKIDSLIKARTDIQFSLTLSKKTEAYLQKREKLWKDSLTVERARNKEQAARIIKKVTPVQLTQSEVDSTLTERYKVKTHLEPSEVGSSIVADLDVMDKALEFIPQEEQEIEHWQQQSKIRDSLDVVHAQQDSLHQALDNKWRQQTDEQKKEGEAMSKENKKLTRGNKFWKGVCKVLGGALVAVGFIAYTK